jgi:hypothetical protein
MRAARLTHAFGQQSVGSPRITRCSRNRLARAASRDWGSSTCPRLRRPVPGRILPEVARLPNATRMERRRSAATSPSTRRPRPPA